MIMPEAIKKQMEEGEKLHKELYGKTEDIPEEITEEEPEQVIPEEDLPVEPAPEEHIEEEIPVTEISSSEIDDLKKQLDDSEHRYRVLQGKYNAEIPRLHEEIRNLKESVKEPPKEPKKPEAPAPKPEAFEDYGDEIVQLASTVQNLEGALTDLKNENADLKKRLEGVGERQVQSDEDNFWSTLSRNVKDWQSINQDQEFIEWLNVVEPFTGRTRGDLLHLAQNNLDVDRVTEFFNMFKKEKEKAGRKQNGLKKQIVPSKKKASPPVEPSGKPTFQYSEYTGKLADLDKRKQEKKITDEEYHREFKTLHDAYREGRVT